jgi:serine protease Do
LIETLDGKQFKIKEIFEKSRENDYIIFRVNIGNYNILNPLPVVSQLPEIGEDVVAIGNPRGLESTLSLYLT